MNYTLDAGGRWTNDAGKVTIDTPQMVAGLSRWKTIVKDSLTPRDLAVRRSPPDVRRRQDRDAQTDGPWLWPIMQKGKAKDQIKLATVALQSRLIGGSSNVLRHRQLTSPKDNKKLVWGFIQIATSDRFQSQLCDAGRRAAAAPARRFVSAAAKETPHFDLLVQADQAPRPTPRSTASRRAWSSPSTSSPRWSWRRAQRMIIQDLDPKVVAATMQRKAEALQKQ
jgi:multiple sugar transport system substrate-binding protein